jgi:hypothetical protein
MFWRVRDGLARGASWLFKRSFRRGVRSVMIPVIAENQQRYIACM